LHISPSSCEHSENTETSDDELSTPVEVRHTCAFKLNQCD